MINKLKIVKVTNKRAWSLCPFHKDKNKPNLSITLTGQYRGRYRCFACGKWGQLSEQQLKKLNLKDRKMPKKVTTMDWNKLYTDYMLECDINRLRELAEILEVDYSTLSSFGCGWDGEAWTFPMHNELQDVIGIQRRFADGRKLNVEGSMNGLFDSCSNPVFVAEGLSDAMMLYDLGFTALGRQNCNGQEDIVLNRIVDCPYYPIIVADNDEPGIKGANKLMKHLNDNGIKSTIFVPPYKDVREWVKNDGRDVVKKKMKELLC